MSKPLHDPHHEPLGLDVGAGGSSARLADGPPAGPHLRVRTPGIREVVVIEVSGRLLDVVEDLDWAIQLALASGPRGVACDLTDVTDVVEPAALEALASVGRHVRDWQGVPVAIASPDHRVRATLGAHPQGGQLIVTKSMLSALYAVLRTPAPTLTRLRLAPRPTAPGAAREFVTSTLRDWQLDAVVPSACLVTSELVTNAILYAGSRTDIELSLAWSRRSLRLTVLDHSPVHPRIQDPSLDLHGRGLTIVAGVSHAFGVLPTADGGKVVWAVLDVPEPLRTQPLGARSQPEGALVGDAGQPGADAPLPSVEPG